VAVGISGGILPLSRSLAPVYALPLAVVIVVDLICSHRARLSELPWLGVGIARAWWW
jgi:hypothetical protein